MSSMKDKRSLHSTVNAPRRTSKGPPAPKSPTNLIVHIVSALIVIAISVCCLGILYFKYEGNGSPTPSPQVNISTMIASTSIAAQKQTMVAAPVASSTLFIPTSVILHPPSRPFQATRLSLFPK